MKAIVVREFGGPEVLKIEERPDPKQGPSEIVVRIRAIGVNPVDTYIRAGAYARMPSLPYVPGSDAAGEIETVGAAVPGFAPGDRIYMCGTLGGGSVGAYAERALCAPTQVYRLPARVSFAQGAAFAAGAVGTQSRFTSIVLQLLPLHSSRPRMTVE